MKCWKKGCNGNHDSYFHPLHNCKPPEAWTVKLNQKWTCDCGKEWQMKSSGKPNSRGWTLLSPL